MRIKVDRGVCPVQKEFCEHCPGRHLFEKKIQEARCFLTYDDSDPELFSIELCVNEQRLMIKPNDHQRQMLMAG